MWYPGKKLKELEKRVAEIEKHTIRTRELFNSRFAEAIDRRYVFDEILECLDDIMEHLQL